MKILKLNTNRLIISISIGALLSLLMSFGTYTQAMFLNGILGDAESLCDALCSTGLASAVSFREWFNSFYNYLLLPLSILVCYISLRYKNLRPVFWTSVIGIFITLSIGDAFILLFRGTGIEPFLESCLSNILGSPILAFMFCLILTLIRRLAEYILIKPLFSITYITLFFTSLLLLTLYIFVKNVFWEMKSDFSMVLSPNFYGSYTTSKNDKDRFGVFQNNNQQIEDFRWSGIFSNMDLSIANSNKTALVKLYLYQGCGNETSKELLTKLSKPNISFTKVKNLNFKIKYGVGDMSIYSRNGSNGNWIISESDTTKISVLPGKKSGDIQLNLISLGDKELIHENWQEETWYRFETATIGGGTKEARSFSINADEQNISYEIETDESIQLSKIPKCQQINASAHPTLISHFQITVLLSVTYPQIQRFNELKPPIITHVKGLQGWFSVKEFPTKDLEKFIRSGALANLNFVGAFQEIFVGTSKLEKRTKHWLYLNEGEISLAVHGAELDLRGKVNSLIVDGNRMNKSRWERIKSYFGWVAVFMTGAIAFLLKNFWAMWKKDEDIVKFNF